MLIVALFVGVILIVAAVRNSQDALFAALKTDVPGYIVWAAAIFAVGAVGWIPGLKPVSRGLLALVLLVIILRNYTAILAGLKSGKSATGGAAPASAADPNNAITPGGGSFGGGGASAGWISDITSAVNSFGSSGTEAA